MDRSSAPHIATLVVASAVGPVAMSVFLPALPLIGSHFSVDYAVVQLAVPLYLVATAIFQLIIGSLSDQYGRRVVMIACLLISMVATVAAIYAPNVEIFLAARVFQAVAVAGIAIGRAAIRDTVDADESASRIGYVTMGMTLAPMLGPVLGGYLTESYGWESTFWLIFVVGALALVLVWIDMGETNSTLGGRLISQMKSYPVLFRSRRFVGYSMTSAFASGAFFGFLGGAPFLSEDFYHLAPSQYGYYFAFVAGGYTVGNFLSGRYSRRMGINRMMIVGAIVATLGMVTALLLYTAGILHPLAFFSPFIAVGTGNGLLLPNANAGIVSVRPHIAGAASGLGGFLQVGGGAAVAVLAGMVVGPGSGPAPLIWLMLLTSVLSIVSALYVIWVARSLAAQN